MYPPVTQFETRHRTILDGLRIRESGRLARPSTSPIPRHGSADAAGAAAEGRATLS